jgi:hypothetical protein
MNEIHRLERNYIFHTLDKLYITIQETERRGRAVNTPTSYSGGSGLISRLEHLLH